MDSTANHNPKLHRVSMDLILWVIVGWEEAEDLGR